MSALFPIFRDLDPTNPLIMSPVQTSDGILLSALAILLVVMLNVSWKGASPLKSSYGSTPNDHGSILSS